jgi:starvation-inducible DNA-binding protein
LHKREKSVVILVLADYEVLIRGLRTAIKAAQDIEDEVTADLLIGLLAKYEKNVWMLEAYLK